jgi:hypothetical protein
MSTTLSLSKRELPSTTSHGAAEVKSYQSFKVRRVRATHRMTLKSIIMTTATAILLVSLLQRQHVVGAVHTTNNNNNGNKDAALSPTDPRQLRHSYWNLKLNPSGTHHCQTQSSAHAQIGYTCLLKHAICHVSQHLSFVFVL